jgi:hypothetical protein
MNEEPKQPPAYLEEAARIAAELPPGTVGVVEVHHDHDCDLLNHRGECTCTPVERLRRPS